MPAPPPLVKVYHCPHCAGERLKKNGRNAAGSQRARCQECKRTFVLEPKAPRYGSQERERILAAATLERMSLRAIGRTFGPCHQTLVRWAKKKGGRAAGAGRDASGRPEGRRAGAG